MNNTLKNEKAFLKEIINKLKIKKEELTNKIKKTNQQIEDTKKAFDDIHIKTSTYSNITETSMSVRTQQQILDQQEASWKGSENLIHNINTLLNKPYFARIDFKENQKKETIYIGSHSFIDKDKFLIYDWRAPISSIYYDSNLGKASYQTPSGKQLVDVLLKRQFDIKKGKLINYFDTNEAVVDQKLLETLSNTASTKMKSIVTTIQKEQNTIIRDDKHELIFVQGVAGSGKTATILQRIAWLLYRYRNKIYSSQIILFSPNQLFNDYINQVLPELGEHNVVQTTYEQLLHHKIPKIKLETIHEQYENNIKNKNNLFNQIESSLSFFNAVKNYASLLNKKGIIFNDIKINNKIIFSKKEIENIYYSFNENYKLNNRIDATKELLVKKLNEKVKKIAKSKQIEKQIQLLSQENINNICAEKQFKNQDEQYKFIANQLALKALKTAHQKIIHNSFLNIKQQFIDFLNKVPNFLSTIKNNKESWFFHINYQLSKETLSIDLTTVFIFLYDLLIGKKGDKNVKFIFIDEVQDYSSIQIAYLKYCYPKAKFTLLGDLNQTIFNYQDNNVLTNDLKNIFANNSIKTFKLQNTYRSTKQITNFSKDILEQNNDIIAFNRNGDKPIIKFNKGFDEQYNNLLNYLNENDNVTIITKTLSESILIDNFLKKQKVKYKLIKEEKQNLTKEHIVIPAFLAKGLEFNHVLVWNVNDNFSDNKKDRQLLYTICSRAMHKLILFTNKNKPNEIIKKLKPDLYDIK